MNNKNNLNLTDDIKDILNDVLNNNFTRLNQNIERVRRNAVDEFKNTKISFFSQKKYMEAVGKVSGILFTVFGGVGSLAFGISVFVLSILSFPFGKIFSGISLMLLPFFIASVIFLFKGIKTLSRLKRAKRYMACMKGRSYILMEDLARRTRLEKRYVEKDLDKMINVGIFPEGHMDKHKTYFMISDKTYEEYTNLQKSIGEKKLQEEKEQAKNGNLDPNIKKAIDEGRNFVLKIKEANAEIPGEEISLKLERLEEITEKIFDYVELNPKKLPEIKKFSEYFLPTSLKLVDTYKKLECNPLQGENILKAKREIEESLDTINLAFENLLDGLFEDIAMDISTDISVLETMLAQEGLTKNSMRVDE